MAGLSETLMKGAVRCVRLGRSEEQHRVGRARRVSREAGSLGRVGPRCLHAVRRFDGQQQSLESLRDMIVWQGLALKPLLRMSLPIYQGFILVRAWPHDYRSRRWVMLVKWRNPPWRSVGKINGIQSLFFSK